MKRLTTILLVALLLLNVLGYYGVFVGLQYQNNRNQISRLDGELYDESETFTLRIPISIPYAMDQAEFERVNGEFEYEGQYYRMVKQKFSNDTLHIVCIKDQHGARITQALKDYLKSFTNNPGHDQSDGKSTVTFIKDYIPSSSSLTQGSDGWSIMISPIGPSKNLVPSFCTSIVHPPERA